MMTFYHKKWPYSSFENNTGQNYGRTDGRSRPHTEWQSERTFFSSHPPKVQPPTQFLAISARLSLSSVGRENGGRWFIFFCFELFCLALLRLVLFGFQLSANKLKRHLEGRFPFDRHIRIRGRKPKPSERIIIFRRVLASL